MKTFWRWLKKPIPPDMSVPVIILSICLPLVVFIACRYQNEKENWKKAHDSLLTYTKMTPQVLVKDHGWLTPDPKAKFHIIIGYQIDNCIIELPPDGSVIAGNDIYVDNPRIKYVFELAEGGR